jgi:hypothetical protein
MRYPQQVSFYDRRLPKCCVTQASRGAVGLHRGLGKRRSFTRAVIQVSGTISHISANVFERAVEQSDTIKDIITQYTEVLGSKRSRLPHATPFTVRKRGLPDGCCKRKTELIRIHFP